MRWIHVFFVILPWAQSPRPWNFIWYFRALDIYMLTFFHNEFHDALRQDLAYTRLFEDQFLIWTVAD